MFTITDEYLLPFIEKLGNSINTHGVTNKTYEMLDDLMELPHKLIGGGKLLHDIDTWHWVSPDQYPEEGDVEDQDTYIYDFIEGPAMIAHDTLILFENQIRITKYIDEHKPLTTLLDEISSFPAWTGTKYCADMRSPDATHCVYRCDTEERLPKEEEKEHLSKIYKFIKESNRAQSLISQDRFVIYHGTLVIDRCPDDEIYEDSWRRVYDPFNEQNRKKLFPSLKKGVIDFFGLIAYKKRLTKSVKKGD